MNKNLLYRGSAVIIILAIGLLLYIYYLLFWPMNILTMTQPTKVLTKQVKRGDKVFFELDYCKYTDASAVQNNSFVNDISFGLQPVYSNVKPGCYHMVMATKVPVELALGKYHLHTDIRYRVNQLRTISYHFDSEEFTVVE